MVSVPLVFEVLHGNSILQFHLVSLMVHKLHTAALSERNIIKKNHLFLN